MRQGIGFGFTLMLVGSLTGCGGGGGGSAGPAAVASLYAGHWAGTWNDDQGSLGTLNVTVGTDGRLTGTVFSVLGGETAAATGQVTSAGRINATYAYPRSGPIQAVGTVALTGAGQLVGNVQEMEQGQLLANGTFTLTRQ